MVTAAPQDAGSWLRLARTVSQIRPRDARERALLLDRATTAAYIAYQRSNTRNEEADSLVLLGRTLAERKQWRSALDTLRLALTQREAADLRVEYEKLRAEHGFRMLDYSVDSDAISPRACFQFSENLPGKRTDFSPYVAVVGIDKPAISVTDRQLCVEGLKHGERYAITLRAGLPSVVNEALTKTAEFTIFVRDRKPFVRFSGKAYVLPRTGQRGIPVLSVNTSDVLLSVYRVGDRNLVDTVLGYQFQRNFSRYRRRTARQRERRQGVERRTVGDAEAQHRGHHRVPGRPGAWRSEIRRLRYDGQAERSADRRLSAACHAMVHRFRSRPDRL